MDEGEYPSACLSSQLLLKLPEPHLRMLQYRRNHTLPLLQTLILPSLRTRHRSHGHVQNHTNCIRNDQRQIQ
jgi:hypothetical protein